MRKLIPDFLNHPYALPLAGIGATLILIALLIQIPAVAKSRLVETLAAAGFKDAQIGTVSIRPSMVIAEGIKLDQYGFDEIKALGADINWISFLFTGKINGLTIQGVKLGRDATNMGPGARQLLNTLLSLPHYRIRLTDLTLDITTDFGEIRLIAEAQVNSDDKPGERDIKAHIKAEQYQLVFDSSWQGVLKDDGQLDLTAAIEGGRLNAGPLRVSRFNGWAGAAAKDGQYEWQSQMEAGSASFMDVPLQKLSLVSAYSAGKTSVIFRSGVSGMSDVLFTADLAKSDEADMFTANLSGKHLGNFLDYVEESTGRKKIIRDALVSAGEFSMVTRFEAEKRFVGGPLPFSLTLETNGAQSVEGNVLFYPDTLDVRGSLGTSTAMAQALQDYFKIPAANMRQNFIRLDGDARHFFYLDPSPSDAESEKDED